MEKEFHGFKVLPTNNRKLKSICGRRMQRTGSSKAPKIKLSQWKVFS